MQSIASLANFFIGGSLPLGHSFWATVVVCLSCYFIFLLYLSLSQPLVVVCLLVYEVSCFQSSIYVLWDVNVRLDFLLGLKSTLSVICGRISALVGRYVGLVDSPLLCPIPQRMSFAPSDVMMMRRQDSKQYNRNRKKPATSSLCFVPKGKMGWWGTLRFDEVGNMQYVKDSVFFCCTFWRWQHPSSS